MNQLGRRMVWVMLILLIVVLLTGWYIIQARSPKETPDNARLVHAERREPLAVTKQWPPRPSAAHEVSGLSYQRAL